MRRSAISTHCVVFVTIADGHRRRRILSLRRFCRHVVAALSSLFYQCLMMITMPLHTGRVR